MRKGERTKLKLQREKSFSDNTSDNQPKKQVESDEDGKSEKGSAELEDSFDEEKNSTFYNRSNTRLVNREITK